MSNWKTPFALGGFNDNRESSQINSIISGGKKPQKSKKNATGKSEPKRFEDYAVNQKKMKEEKKEALAKLAAKKNVNWREKHKEEIQKKIDRRDKSDKGFVRNGVVEFSRKGDSDDDDDVDGEDALMGRKTRYTDIHKNIKDAKSEAARLTELDLARFNDDDDEDDSTTLTSSKNVSRSGVSESAKQVAQLDKIKMLQEEAEYAKKMQKKDKKDNSKRNNDKDEEHFDFGGEVIKYNEEESDDENDSDDDDDGNDDNDDNDESESNYGNLQDESDDETKDGFNLSQTPKVKKLKKNGGFESMSLLPEVYQGVRKMGYRVPTPIQRKAIPVLIEGRDCVAMARTGSGKTAAFTIPILNRLQNHNYVPPGAFDDRQARVGPQWCRAVVLSPTRELAIQTHKVICKLGKFLDLRYCLLVGGQQMEVQFTHLTNCPDIIIATPGRLVHHLIEIRFELNNVEVIVYDEADRMFELGFATQLHEIQRRSNPSHLTWLFSATMPKALAEFSRAGLKQPVTIRLDSESKLSPDLKVSFFSTRTEDRLGLLQYLLQEVIPEKEQLLVFVATKLVVEFVEAALRGAGHAVTSVHGTMDAEVRNENVEAFRTRKTRIMVVTDLAARGIDIPLLDNVLNFDFPSKAKLFIHRCGRVARAGRPGLAMSFVTPQELPYLLDVYIFFGWPLQQFVSKETEFSATLADREILEQAKRASEGKNERDNPNRVVEIGRPPFQMIEDQIRFMSNKCEELYLGDMERAAMNSYKLYRKMRHAASVASAKLWKEMETLGFHPVFYRQEESRLEKVRSKGIKPGETVATLSQLEEMDRALLALSRFTPRETVFEMMHADTDGFMKTKRSVHDPTIRKDKENRASITELLENRVESRVERNQISSEGHGNPEKRKGELARSLEKVPSVTTSSNPEEPIKRKIRLSTAMKRKMKKAGANKLGNQPSIEELTREAAEAGGLEVSGGTMTKRVKRSKMSPEERKDPMFISTLPTESYIEELGMSIHGGDAFNVELTADTGEGLQERKRVKIWDARKKDFKVEYNNKNPFGQLKNESGAKISGGKASKVTPGELYDKWVQGGRPNPRNANRVEGFSEGFKNSRNSRSEIKSRDEIMKQRKDGEVSRAKFARTHKKKK